MYYLFLACVNVSYKTSGGPTQPGGGGGGGVQVVMNETSWIALAESTRETESLPRSLCFQLIFFRLEQEILRHSRKTYNKLSFMFS